MPYTYKEVEENLLEFQEFYQRAHFNRACKKNSTFYYKNAPLAKVSAPETFDSAFDSDSEPDRNSSGKSHTKLTQICI